MKSLIIIFGLMLTYSIDSAAQRFKAVYQPSRTLSCIWQSTIGTSGKICYRRDAEILVKPKAYKAIKSVELVISGKSMGKDSSYPFRWNINPKLKGLYAGRHRTTAKIIDICGKEHHIHKILEVHKCPPQ